MAKKKIKEISNKVPLYDASGKSEGVYELDKHVFNGVFSTGLIHQAVLMYQANKRQGNASTKVRKFVSGGGKKPWKQKGTGRARASSIRSPLWRGGGIVFGPHPRNFKYQIPVKMKRAALLHSLNAKVSAGSFGVIKDIRLDEPKTAKFKKIIDKTKIAGRILLAVDSLDRNVNLASRNFKSVDVITVSGLNTMAVMKACNFLATEKAVSEITAMFRKNVAIKKD